MRITPKESEIQKSILEGLQAHKIFAFRLNTAAMKVGSRFFRAHSLGAGAADIIAFPVWLIPSKDLTRWMRGPTTVLWIECKTEKGKQSPPQKVFEKMVTEYGHHYIVARSWDDVEAWEKSMKSQRLMRG